MAEKTLEQKIETNYAENYSGNYNNHNAQMEINSKYKQISRKFNNLRRHYSIFPLKTLNRKDKETLSSYKKDLLGLIDDSIRIKDNSLTYKINNLYSVIDNFIYKTKSKITYS